MASCPGYVVRLDNPSSGLVPKLSRVSSFDRLATHEVSLAQPNKDPFRFRTLGKP